MSHKPILIVLALVLITFSASADIPKMISYQGKVTDTGGSMVADGSYDMQFDIYDAVTGGTALWNSGTVSVQVTSGIFNVLLGESPQPTLNLDFDEDCWIEVTIESDVQSPRQRLGSGAYAYMASGLVPGTVVTGSMTDPILDAQNTETTGEAPGIRGATTSTEGYAVIGHAEATDGSTRGVYGVTDSPSGTGVYGEVTATSLYGTGVIGKSASEQGNGVIGWATSTGSGQNYGGYFRTDGSNLACAVYGKSTATTGETYGGYFENNSLSGRGVYGEASATSGTTYGVFGSSASTTGTGIYGHATASEGTTFGGYFESDSREGSGVYGKANDTNANGIGVWGISYSPWGSGVYGETLDTSGSNQGGYFLSMSTSGTGVRGQAISGSGVTYGVRGISNSTSGRGVFGEATAGIGATYGGYFKTQSSSGFGVFAEAEHTIGENYGGYFWSHSTSGLGVYGRVSATSGDTYGVYGQSASPDGVGVFGYTSATIGTNNSVFGVNSSNSGRAIYGRADANSGSTYGVYGENDSSSGRAIRALATATTGTNYAIHATTNSTTGYAGYFSGTVHVNGNLSKSSGSFLIDHPQDPENKLLRHNFVESPENLLIYRGTAHLNDHGEAIVQMPGYFSSLTQEVEATVTLTPLGKPFLVGYDMGHDHLSFKIYGDPDRDVSWVVYAERDDPVIRQQARPVEEEKGPDNKYCDRGKLLNPTAYGYPESMGRDFELHERERMQREKDRDRLEQERNRLESLEADR